MSAACDDTMYRSSISSYLDAQSERHNDNTKFQVVLDVLHLTNVLNSAKENAIPNHKNLRTDRAKMKGKPLWNEEIGQASKQAKTVFHHWKNEGGIKSNNNKSYNDMKASKKILRQK